MIALYLFLLSFVSPTAPHDFHVSRCEIVYRTETSSLEVTFHMFADDVEQGIRMYRDTALHLGTEIEVDDAEKHFQDYLSDHFFVEAAGGRSIALNYLGKEAGEDQMALWAYIEGTGVNGADELVIGYDLLCEMFEDQKNIVSFQVDNARAEMFLLDGNKRTATVRTR